MEQSKINIVVGDIIKEDSSENPISEECLHAIEFLLSEDRLNDISYDEDEKECAVFDSFLQKNDMQHLVFMGDDGIGKTEFLRKYFSISVHDTFKIENHKLLIMFSGDGNGILENGSDIKYFAEEIKKVCEYYEQAYIEESEYVIRNYSKFYVFILETKKSALSHSWLEKGLDDSVYMTEIEDLKKNKPFTYYMLKLKYYLLLSQQITDLIVICDNIISKNIYVEIADKIDKCIRNYNKIKNKGYRTKTIFAINNSTYWHLLNKNNLISDITVQKSKNFNIQGLLEAGFDYAKALGEVWMREHGFDMQALQNVKEALDFFNTRFNQKYQRMILGLCMHNKKLVLKCYRTVMCNQTWVRKKRFSYADNAYDENPGFLFNNITCIRALACGNEQVYNPVKIRDYLIPNILYNTEDEDYGIYNLLLMKYFVKRQGNHEFIGNKQENILAICENIWGKSSEYDNFEKAINYLLSKKVLDRYTLCTEEHSGHLFITEKGIELWDMFHGDSILMEICREDRFRDVNLNMEPSYILLNTKRQYLIFEDLLNMTRGFSSFEDKLYLSASERGCSVEYIRTFGKKRMAYYLLEGVSKSITYSVSRSNENLKSICKEVRDLVEAER
ncbi:hypothetical protein C823_002712 [Eubacterium plexicaudatum ASF492]|uniref:Uncharacterized protein n=1 Tax=Eubacterium plexicaudatum ASF492 TaxID=1235802 RepID=N2A9P1_9FIRM|nr:hypothetical protein C823_002712 [Eubacterium plexicaudatum ASF492]